MQDVLYCTQTLASRIPTDCETPLIQFHELAIYDVQIFMFTGSKGVMENEVSR